MFYGLIEDLVSQLSITFYSAASAPGLPPFHLTWALVSHFFFVWPRVLTQLQAHLEHCLQGTARGPRLDGVLSWGPHHTWHTSVLALRFQMAMFLMPSLCTGLCWACLLHPILPLSLPSLYPPLSLHQAPAYMAPQFLLLLNLYPSQLLSSQPVSFPTYIPSTYSLPTHSPPQTVVTPAWTSSDLYPPCLNAP